MKHGLNTDLRDAKNANANGKFLPRFLAGFGLIKFLSVFHPCFICGSVLFLAIFARAQTPLSNLVFTVGTSASNNWSYVLVNATTPSLLLGKRFAVYGKPGYPTNAGTFTLRGNIFQQTDTSAINVLLNQSIALGQDLNALNNSFAHVVGSNVVGLLHNVP